jgi:gliding motility-associated-like protein
MVVVFTMRSFLIFSFILFFFFECYSQSKEGAYWYWGNRAGLNFNKNPVEPDTLGQTFDDIWATISDSLGNLLFYTNGYKIFNQNHQLVFDTIPASSFYGAIICPKPGSSSTYFILYKTIGSNGFDGNGYYFEYDVSLNNGQGARKSPPIVFEDSLSGFTIALLQHADSKRFWVMGYKRNTPEIRTYLVDSNGISTVPVISTSILPPISVTGNFIPHLDIKSSPNSQYIFLSLVNNGANSLFDFVLCFQFNRTTGQAFNRFYSKQIPPMGLGIYGGFSPNSNILYYSLQSTSLNTTPGQLYQVDISSLNQTTIQNSEVLLKSFNFIGQYHLGSQIGLDGKIYLSYNTGFPSSFAPFFLARINCPNVPGLGCGYQDTAVNLEDRRPGVFFPVLNQTLFVNANLLQVKSNKLRTCQGDSVELSAFGAGADNFTWSPATGLSDPFSANPKAAPSVTTTYTVTGISNCGTSSTASITIRVVPRPAFTASISPACIGDSSTLSFTGAYPFVRWSPGATLADSTLAITKGRFLQNTPVFVRALDTSGLCTALDTLLAVVNPLPTALSLAGPDTTKCATSPIQLGTSPVPNLSYQWGLVPTGLPTGLQNPNTAQPLFTFVPPATATNPQTFTYRLQVTDSNGCKNADTVQVFVRPLSKRLAGADLSFCSGDSAQTGTANLTGVAYSWIVEPINPFPGAASLSDTSIARPIFRAVHNDSIAKTFRLIVRGVDIPIGIGSNCINQDTAIATVNPLPTADSIVIFTTCSGVSLTLTEPLRANYSYLWKDIINSQLSILNSFTISFLNNDTLPRTDTLLLTLTDTLTGCTKTVIRLVRINPLPRPNAGPDSLICSGDTINIGTPPRTGLSYFWSPITGIQNPTNSQTAFTASNTTNSNQTQTRIVLATDSLTGCQNRDTVRITVSGVPRASIIGPLSVCPGLEGAFYTLNGLNPFTTIAQGWQVQGGQIDSSSINSAIINWDSIPTDSARVILIPTNARGCKGDTARLTVRINKELATETPNGDTVICSGTGNRTYSILNTTGSSYFWQAAGTNILAGQGTNSITVRIPDTLSQTITFSVWVNESSITRTDTCLGNSDTLQITVNASPVRRSILPQIPSLCANDTIAVNLNGTAISIGSSYNWQVLSSQANLISGQGNDTASIRLNPSTTSYTLPVRVRETSDKGCAGPQIDTILLINAQPITQAGADISLCSGDSLQLGATTQIGTIYNWSPSTNLSNANLAQPIFTTTNFSNSPQAISYQLNTQNQQGCRNRDSLLLTVNPEPAPGAQIAGPQGWCSTGTATYNLNPLGAGSTLVWIISPVGTLQVNALAQTITLINTNPQDSGAFQLKVLETNPFGCSGDTVSRTISLFSQPRPQLSPDSIACEGNLDFSIQVTNPKLGSNFNWLVQQTNPGQILGQGTPSIRISFGNPFGDNQTRSLQVTETSSQGCTSDTVSKTIYLDGSSAEILRATTLVNDEKQVEVLYRINNPGLTNQLNRSYNLERSVNLSTFQAIFSNTNSSNRFTEASPSGYPAEAVQYRLNYLDACTIERQSRIHQLISLSGSVTEEPLDQSQSGYRPGSTQLNWNEYLGWQTNAPERFDLFRSTNQAPAADFLYRQRVDPPWEEANGSDAFTQTYRVRASTQDEADTIRFSWSNSLTLRYQNPLKFYNLVTPNGDGLNETFVISNVQLYEHRLTILDRWGRTVLQTDRYNNDWSTKVGGTYFYRLENRTTGEQYSGWVQVVE